MTTHILKLSGLLLALAMPALGVLPGAAWSERGPVQRPTAAAAEDPADARVIVKYKADSTLMRALSAAPGQAGVRPQHAAALAQRLRLPLTDGRVLGSRTQALRGTGLTSSQLAARLAAQPDVEWAVPDRRRTINALPNDPFFAAGQASPMPAVGQWYLRAPDNTALAAINAVGAWNVTTGSASITVAVLDTGVRFDHPDLAGKLYPGYDFVHDTAGANDGNGRDADASDPGDWTAAGECNAGEAASDSSWHGTQVAGLIGAATDNAIGMASVGRNVMVLPVRVLGKCGGFDSDIIAAMRWAAGLTSDVGTGTAVVNSHPAQVINMSLGSAEACPASYREVIAELGTPSVVNPSGVAVVVAAGNDTGHAVNSPANCPGAIAVAGVRHAGSKVGFSNIGPEIAIAAPAGNCVNIASGSPCLFPLLTTVNTGTTTPLVNTYSDSLRPSLGTSFAAPLVAGSVALMLSVNPALTPAQVKATLQSTARAFPSTGADNGPDDPTPVTQCVAPSAGVDQLQCYCTTSTCGAGLLDAAAAVAKVAGSALAPIAIIANGPAIPLVGLPVSLDGSSSSRSATIFQWSLKGGSSIASFASASTAAKSSLSVTGEGDVTVSLLVTDASGVSATTDTSFTVLTPPTAVVGASTPTPTVGATVTLDGSGSTAHGSRTITGYQWAITAGSALASLSGATNAATATLDATAAGSVTVQLTVTDSGGATAVGSTAITIAAPAPPPPPPPAPSSGGGALGWGWLAGLAAAVLALRTAPERQRRAR